MSEQDKYYEQAKMMVEHCRYCDRHEDSSSRCAVDIEFEFQEVAAALRAQGQEIERLQGAIAYDRFHAVAEIAQLKAQLATLYDKIMNIPMDHAPSEFDWSNGYRYGHRDARHAAAELVAAMAQPKIGE